MSTANLAQLEAIQHIDGPLLIIAGPGSGKTYTLVERIMNLLVNHDVQPEQILVVTFTEKAAQELKTRISNRLLESHLSFNVNDMYLGTFHSICLRLLDEYREYTRLKRSYVLMDQFDQQYYLYQNLNHFKDIEGIEHIQGEHKRPAWVKSENLLQWLNKAAEEALNPETLVQSGDEAIEALGNCCLKYRELLVERNALDFSTIQLEALNLLEQHPQVVTALQEKIEYLMVDEYQDTNTIQERILKLLMDDRQNLCVVGDDDQALYRFRGATIRNILEFPEQFEDGKCKTVKLTTNYRSHPDIVEFNNWWINDKAWERQGVSYRYAKNIEPRKDSFPDSPTVVSAIADEGDNWHNEVYDLLTNLKENGQLSDWNQVAFLFRSVKHDRVRALAQSLEDRGIPVYSPRANLFFQREEVQLMIGALQMLFPSVVQEREKERQGGKSLAIWDFHDRCLRLFMEALRKPEQQDLLEWCKRMSRYHLTLTKNADYAFSKLFYDLLAYPLFSSYLDNHDNPRAQRNLATLSQLLGKFEYLHHVSVLNPKYLQKNLSSLFNQFLRFLYDGGIDEYEDTAEYAPSGSVSFLTIHQSKGLEFPVVVVGSLGASPRKQYTELDEVLENGYLSKPPFEPIEETKYFDFWRLYYTAFSRAQNLLILSDQEKNGHGKTPSKYFAKFVEKLPSWRDARSTINRLPLEPVKDVNIKNEYAFTSHITLFETCPEQYRFFKELAFQPIKASPMLFGTLVHETLEDIHKAALRGESKTITAENIRGWFDDNYRNLANRERMYLGDSTLEAAFKHVMRYVKGKKGNWSDIRDTEVDISLVKDSYILKGSVDLIRGKNDSVEIVDFKTERKPDMDRDRERILHHQRQLEIYAHLVEQRTGLQVSRMHLYFTGETHGLPTISFGKNIGSIESTISAFDQVVDRIEQQNYQMSERPQKVCPDCDMRSYCDRRNWHFCKAS